MFEWFRRKDKPFVTKPVDNARSDLRKARVALGLGLLSAGLGLHITLPILGPVIAMIGAAGVFTGGAIRSAIFFDFYARRQNADNKGTGLTRRFESLSARTPLRHLAQLKIEQDRRTETLREIFNKIDARINAAPDDDQKKIYKKDQKSYQTLLNMLNPNGSLMPAALGGLVFLRFGREVVRTALSGTAALTSLALFVPSVLAAATISAAYISLYGNKKNATGISHPAIEALNQTIEKTPLRHLVGWKLRREMRKLDKLPFSDELVQDMAAVTLDQNIRPLVDRAGYKPEAALSRIFAAADARGTAPLVNIPARPPADAAAHKHQPLPPA